ncbi:MAG: hypothetical protein EOP04_12055 [Proteobacteria bacterium]|nr:MAG: hypothetical protein EOP04_12055 [Pseudomonadota bacterium]
MFVSLWAMALHWRATKGPLERSQGWGVAKSGGGEAERHRGQAGTAARTFAGWQVRRNCKQARAKNAGLARELVVLPLKLDSLINTMGCPTSKGALQSDL